MQIFPGVANGHAANPAKGGYTAIPQEIPGWHDQQKTLLIQASPFAQPSPLPKPPSCMERWEEGHFTINPEENMLLEAWDVVVIVALVFTAVILPYEVALVTHPPLKLYVVDKCIDCIFALDILVTFNVAYHRTSSMSFDSYERRPLEIARHYMAIPFTENMTAGWFWPDVFTVIPFELFTSADSLKSVRVVRVLRLVRMLRLVRVVKLFKRWHTHFGFSFAAVKIVRCMGISLVSLHWLACWWAHLGLHTEDYFEGDVGTWIDSCFLVTSGQRKRSDFTAFEAYTLALYMCTVVLVTVGFGDVTPVTHMEILLMTVTILATGLTWAWVVANVVDVIAKFDIYGSHFNQAMDDLNVLMSTNGVDSHLQLKVRKFMHESYYVHRERHHQETVKWLSEGLQGEIAVSSGVDAICRCVSYLRDVMAMDDQWISDIAQHFHPQMYSPKEFLFSKDSLCVIRKGSAVKRGRILMRDAVIGEDMILTTDILKDSAGSRTLTSCEVMSLTRESLRKVCEKHAGLNQYIRRAQIKLAVRRGFVYIASKLKQLELAGIRPNSKQASAQRLRTSVTSLTSADPMAQIKDMETNVAAQLKKKKGWVEHLAMSWDGNDAEGASSTAMKAMFAQLQSIQEQLKASQSSQSKNSQPRLEMLVEKLIEKVDNLDKRQQNLERQMELSAASLQAASSPKRMSWRKS
eukprot:TRINITY_DN72561_c0_g1_i1.p1 TRINITY_DN72561_c0_g1~~TRINITY_DN72561_c0_g1_i1.p1  ORF type:complete len:690 (-),score=97.02 TRINITY_DN72561_c0_g1_i1:226-2295(-)